MRLSQFLLSLIFLLLTGVALFSPCIAATVPLTHSLTLPNGMRIILQEDHSNPTVGLSAVWRTTTVAPSAAAMNNLINSLLMLDVKKNKADSFRKADVIATDYAPDYSELRATLTKLTVSSFLAGLPQFYLTIPTDATTRAQVIQKLIEDESYGDYRERDIDQLFKQSYNDEIYRLGQSPSAEEWKKISSEDIKEYFEGNFTANNLTLSVVGDIDAKALAQDLTKSWSKFRSSKISNEAYTKQASYRKMKSETKDNLDRDEKVLMIGVNVPQSNHNDSAVLDIVAFLLSAEGEGLLDQRLTSSKKAKSVAVRAHRGLRPGLFTIYITLEKSADEKEIGKIVEDSLSVLTGKDFTPADFAKARDRFSISYKNSFSENSSIASGLAHNELSDNSYLSFYGMQDEYSKISHQELQRVVTRYFKLTKERHRLILMQAEKSI